MYDTERILEIRDLWRAKALVVAALQVKGIWVQLPHDGRLSAEWILSLNGIAAHCGFQVDNNTLTYRLIDLSQQPGNITFSRDLYLTLYHMKAGHMLNNFSERWSSGPGLDHAGGCSTAKRLWGPDGEQYPGVIRPAVQTAP